MARLTKARWTDGRCTLLSYAPKVITAALTNVFLSFPRILVMDKGRVKEFDSPSALLQNPSSSFYLMAKDAGLV